MGVIRNFYERDLIERWYGAHTGTYTQFFSALASAYQYMENVTNDERNGVYMRGPLAGLSGHSVVALWTADA